MKRSIGFEDFEDARCEKGFLSFDISPYLYRMSAQKVILVSAPSKINSKYVHKYQPFGPAGATRKLLPVPACAVPTFRICDWQRPLAAVNQAGPCQKLSPGSGIVDSELKMLYLNLGRHFPHFHKLAQGRSRDIVISTKKNHCVRLINVWIGRSDQGQTAQTRPSSCE